MIATRSYGSDPPFCVLGTQLRRRSVAPMDLTVQIGRRVADVRLAAGMTQAALAQRCGMAVETIGRLERGEQMPSLVRLDHIARALGVALAHLVAVEPKREERHARAMRKLIAFAQTRSADEIEMVTDVAKRILPVEASPRAARRAGAPRRR